MEKDEGLKCLFCGGDLCWDSDVNASDRFAEYQDGDTAVVNYYHCVKCGRSYEIVEPCEEERNQEYKEYWNG